jgi:pimeloyl-ACP methyl ester carboxylesterase
MSLAARAMGLASAIALGVLVALGLSASYSPSGWLMLLAAALVAVGSMIAPERRARRRAIAGAGGGLFALVALARVAFVSAHGTTMTTLPGSGGSGSRWLARVLDEQDVSLLGARGLAWSWELPSPERTALTPAMHGAFVAMRASEGITASPVLDTLLGRQGPAAFDTLVVEAHPGTSASARTPDTAVIFLHGYGGSFALECWMMAEAARAIDALTVCPATEFAGRWWTEPGEQTVRATLAYLAARRITHVYLAGLSNGAIGAIALAPRLPRLLDGLILISGASGRGGNPDLPTLVVHGEVDTRISAAGARAFAARNGATYAGFDGGHFVMMVRRTEVKETIARWLEKTSGRR